MTHEIMKCKSSSRGSRWSEETKSTVPEAEDLGRGGRGPADAARSPRKGQEETGPSWTQQVGGPWDGEAPWQASSVE